MVSVGGGGGSVVDVVVGGGGTVYGQGPGDCQDSFTLSCSVLHGWIHMYGDPVRSSTGACGLSLTGDVPSHPRSLSNVRKPIAISALYSECDHAAELDSEVET